MFKKNPISLFHFFLMTIIALLFSFDAFSNLSDRKFKEIINQFNTKYHTEGNAHLKTKIF